MDLSKAHIAIPLLDVDKVVIAKEWTIDVPQYPGSVDINEHFLPLDAVVVTEPGGLLPFGIYSYDNGASWNGFTNISTNVPSLNLQLSLGYDYSTDSAVAQTRVDATIGSGSTIPVLVKFGFIQTRDINITLDTSLGPQFAQKTVFDSRYPTPKIALYTSVVGTGTPGFGQQITIPHGQSTVPDVRVCAYDSSVEYSSGLTGPALINLGDVRVDSTNVYLVDTISQRVYFVMVYYEEET